jgi:hypothetical protein
MIFHPIFIDFMVGIGGVGHRECYYTGRTHLKSMQRSSFKRAKAQLDFQQPPHTAHRTPQPRFRMAWTTAGAGIERGACNIAKPLVLCY